MDKSNLHFLLGMIGSTSTHSTIQGVDMVLIDRHTRQVLLDIDPKQTLVRECELENGIFMYVVDKNFTLKQLYKVVDEIPSSIKQAYIKD